MVVVVNIAPQPLYTVKNPVPISQYTDKMYIFNMIIDPVDFKGIMSP
jgi:hypothetical protein